MSLLGAIEAGGTKFVLALARADGELVDKAVLPTRGGHETLSAVHDWFEARTRVHGAVATIGAASFGPIGIDPSASDYGRYLTTVKPGWQGVSLPEALAGLGARIVVDTDVNGAALGEALGGAGRGHDTVCYTTVGTGIGSGVVKHGRIVTGRTHYETGHLLVPHDRERDPFEGVCSYHGDCCEGLASGPAIAERWHSGPAALDDPGALQLIGGYLGHLAATLAAFHAPDILIFGGGVMKTPGLLEEIRRAARASLAGYLDYYDRDPDTILVAPGLGDDAGIHGAVALARQLQEDTSDA